MLGSNSQTLLKSNFDNSIKIKTIIDKSGKKKKRDDATEVK
jgi:hypothetical protein